MTSFAPAPPGSLVLPDLAGMREFSDRRLIDVHRDLAAARRRIDALMVTTTAELARRSDRALGQEGLAARLGAASVEQALQELAGATRAEAKALTAVATASSGGTPWLGSVTRSVDGGELSVAAAAAITTGLGSPTADVSADDLYDAAQVLVSQAPTQTPEALARAARQAREELELHRIADLEAHRRGRRSLTWTRLPDGMTRLTALLDPESAAVITTAIDTVLSPRRGGPRFVDASDAARSAALEADTRTTDQLAVDTLVDIVELATRAAGSEIDPARLFGTRSPAVRVHVSVDALIAGEGVARLEGQDAPISAASAARHVCTSGIVPILFREAEAIDVGRTHRLHSTRQRIALAAQWGGCAWHGCSRPPAMTEVHHLARWNGTNTTLKNGIPLCRFHHLQLHNGGWRIEAGTSPAHYRLIPPPGHPVDSEPRDLRPRRT